MEAGGEAGCPSGPGVWALSCRRQCVSGGAEGGEADITVMGQQLGQPGWTQDTVAWARTRWTASVRSRCHTESDQLLCS